MPSADDRDRLLAELRQARDDFSAAMAQADPELLTAPGLVGDWSARELVAHLAHWCDWGSTCMEAAAGGGLASVASDEWDVDAQNAEVARWAADRTMAEVLDREAAAYERFALRLSTLDPPLLAEEAPWGGTLETVVLENGAEHYAEHTAHVRDWFVADDADEPDDDAPAP